ncbi:tetratricopeptide repeat protein [uncultured Reyranella sp.]|uniref:tetratricopeptide repeat protein n=1 Tax=uncultured Reyranella sp. TaxID=735512 RepID=UPI00259D29D1|nr:tetratricopeptide repeat protein [uncultured Reyranella sp.]
MGFGLQRLVRILLAIPAVFLVALGSAYADPVEDIFERDRKYGWTEAMGIIARARAGDAEAQYALGRGLLEGYWDVRDAKVGLEWLKKAADTDQRYAPFILGRLYEKGEHGVSIDVDKARYWYERSFDGGGAYAARALARLDEAKSPPDVERALSWYRRGAEAGDFECQKVLGEYYGAGFRMPLDYSQSLHWLLKAMEPRRTPHAARDVEGPQARLGFYYENGLGTAKNIDEALRWYREAAGNGNADAAYALGRLYEGSENLPANPREAMKFYEAAAERDHPSAQYRLGRGFANGEGLPIDRVQAIKWLTRASRWCCDVTQKEAEAELNRIKGLSTPLEVEAGEALAEAFAPIPPPSLIPQIR